VLAGGQVFQVQLDLHAILGSRQRRRSDAFAFGILQFNSGGFASGIHQRSAEQQRQQEGGEILLRHSTKL
jgi:hypothetical protein